VLALAGDPKGTSIMHYKRLHLIRSVVIASLAIFLSGPVFADSRTAAGSNNGSLVVPARGSPAQVPVPTARTNTNEAQQYASREVSAKGLETFVGGERGGGVYIGSGVLIVALLVVLLIVLI
jgi:hypothetical protein